ncbi:MAG: DUF2628 domain-containing protein [Alphaproteobacteria bacterium]
MQTYTIYERYPASEDIEQRASELVFVKEGFSIFAFLAPLIWLLFNRMWWEAAAFFCLMMFLEITVSLLGIGPEITAVISFLINIIFAFEARNLQRYGLERNGYSMIAIVSGRNLDEAEQRFLSEWLPTAKSGSVYQTTAPGALGMHGEAVRNAASSTGQTQDLSRQPVIGMFPAHGG